MLSDLAGTVWRCHSYPHIAVAITIGPWLRCLPVTKTRATEAEGTVLSLTRLRIPKTLMHLMLCMSWQRIQLGRKAAHHCNTVCYQTNLTWLLCPFHQVYHPSEECTSGSHYKSSMTEVADLRLKLPLGR